MKPIRNIIIIVLVIALLGAGLYFVMNLEPDTEELEQENLPSVSIFSTDANTIESLVVTHPEGNYKLTKGAEGWICDGNSALPLSQSRISSMLFECVNLKGRELVAENVADVTPYGLDVPEKMITIQQSDGETVSIYIGKQTIEGDVCYVSLNDKTKIYTKTASECDMLIMSLSQLIDTQLYTVDAESITSIKLQSGDGETIHLAKVNVAKAGESEKLDWRMQSPISVDANNYALEEILPKISTMTAASAIAVPKGGVDYGLNHPYASFTVSTKNETYTVSLGKQEGALTYVKFSTEPCIYQVATDSVNFVSMSYLELANKLLHVENLKDVQKIKITGLAKDYTIDIMGEGDTGTYKINGQGINANRFLKIYQSIIGLSLDGYTQAGSTSNTCVTIRYERRDGVINTVNCYPFDERNYVVYVNGKGSYLMRKKQIETMVSQLNSVLS